MSTNHTAPYSVKEEIANTLTHGIGMVLGIVGLVLLLLLIKAVDHNADALTITSNEHLRWQHDRAVSCFHFVSRDSLPESQAGA